MKSLIGGIYENTEKAMAKCFWEVFLKDLKEEKYEILEKTIVEIKTKLKNLVPKNQDEHEDIEANLQEQSLMDSIKEGTFDPMMPIKMLNFTVEKIVAYQAPAR